MEKKGVTVHLDEKEYKVAQALTQYLHYKGLIERASVSRMMRFCMRVVASWIAEEIERGCGVEWFKKT